MSLSQSLCLNLLQFLEEVTPSSESGPVPILGEPWSTSIQGWCRVWLSNGQPGFQKGHHLAS